MVRGTDYLRPELEYAAVNRILLDDLYALSGLLQSPIIFVRVGKVLAERGESCGVRFEDLADESQVAAAIAQVRDVRQVSGLDL